jgi:3-methyladenine DNA glycosylase AlkD
VDASAPAIVGGFLAGRDRGPLTRLAGSPSLWERRIAIVATMHFIRQGDFADTLRLAELLMEDHKAAGWMLRDQAVLEGFLSEHCRRMLRYAIEQLPEGGRRQYLKGEA